MPWTAKDAHRHTKKANSAKKQRQWAHVADNALAKGQSEGSAIRQANAVVGHSGMSKAHSKVKRQRMG